jgi:LysM repeat protein
LVTALAALACSGAPNPKPYVVKPGDSLWAIAAARYPGKDPREAVYDIQQVNQLDGSSIVAGQTLLLP